MSAGSLKERVTFAVRSEVDDGYGNTVSGWIEQFQRSAEYVHLRGGETVMASRLQNRHPQVIRVRACSQTRRTTAEWRIKDMRTGIEYAIRDVTLSTDRKWVDFLCERGAVA